eukprot:sb/3466427/
MLAAYLDHGGSNSTIEPVENTVAFGAVALPPQLNLTPPPPSIQADNETPVADVQQEETKAEPVEETAPSEADKDSKKDDEKEVVEDVDANEAEKEEKQSEKEKEDESKKGEPVKRQSTLSKIRDSFRRKKKTKEPKVEAEAAPAAEEATEEPTETPAEEAAPVDPEVQEDAAAEEAPAEPKVKKAGFFARLFGRFKKSKKAPEPKAEETPEENPNNDAVPAAATEEAPAAPEEPAAEEVKAEEPVANDTPTVDTPTVEEGADSNVVIESKTEAAVVENNTAELTTSPPHRKSRHDRKIVSNTDGPTLRRKIIHILQPTNTCDIFTPFLVICIGRQLLYDV